MVCFWATYTLQAHIEVQECTMYVVAGRVLYGEGEGAPPERGASCDCLLVAGVFCWCIWRVPTFGTMLLLVAIDAESSGLKNSVQTFRC